MDGNKWKEKKSRNGINIIFILHLVKKKLKKMEGNVFTPLFGLSQRKEMKGNGVGGG